MAFRIIQQFIKQVPYKSSNDTDYRSTQVPLTHQGFLINAVKSVFPGEYNLLPEYDYTYLINHTLRDGRIYPDYAKMINDWKSHSISMSMEELRRLGLWQSVLQHIFPQSL